MNKPYQGGSTGLEQQKAKRYPPKRKPSEYKYPFIKDEIKKSYDIELVVMGGGIGFHCVEEDAELMKKKYGKKTHDRGGKSPYLISTFPYGEIKSMVNEFDKDKIKYVILNVVDKENAIREIVKSSNEKLIGLQY